MPLLHTSSRLSDADNPALFGDDRTYQNWLTQARVRADRAEQEPAPVFFQLTAKSESLSQQQLIDLCHTVTQYGFACYECSDLGEATDIIADDVSRLLRALGLEDTDEGVIKDLSGLSLLRDRSGTPQGRFPPYQAGAMNWHTDGYYNAPDKTVRAFTLHCIEPAVTGGELHLMDDQLLALALHDDNPDLLRLLSHSDAMTLPKNRDQEGHDRPDRSVPVFSLMDNQQLCLRFTTRTKNIRWRCADTHAAAERAAELIQTHGHWHTQVKLERGQGIVTRNILHARTAFTDSDTGPGRQILRGRFMQLPEATKNGIDNAGS